MTDATRKFESLDLIHKTFTVMSSKHAFYILQLLNERSRKYSEIHDLLYFPIKNDVNNYKSSKAENMHAYYLRRLMAVHAICFKKSVYDGSDIRGIYDITARGKAILKFYNLAEIEFKLQDSQKELTKQNLVKKGKKNYEVRTL